MVELLIFLVIVIAAVWLISTILSITFGIIIPVLIWMLVGFLAGKLLRGEGYGPIGNALLGLAGGIVGSIVLSLLGLSGVGNVWLVGNIIVGVIGAVIVIFGVRLVSGDKSFGA